MEAAKDNPRLDVTVVFDRAHIINADVLMTDGRCLEYSGVTPDELVRPSAEEMAANRDPVLARAAELLGLETRPCGGRHDVSNRVEIAGTAKAGEYSQAIFRC